MHVREPFQTVGIQSPIHAAVVRLLRALPASVGELGCRAYLRLLRAGGSRIRATTYFGAQMECNPRDYVQGFILLFGVWEPDVSITIEDSLQPGDTLLDIGANVGYDALLGATRVGPSGSVIAVEASRRTAEMLRANIALNRFEDRITVRNVAASDRRGTLQLFEVSPSNIGAATTIASRGGTAIDSVEALPLRDILSPSQAKSIAVIKIDVEGAEPPILRDLAEHIADFPRLRHILVEASSGENRQEWREIFDRLRELGFDAHTVANEYSYRWYLKWRRREPTRRIDQPPPSQVDILFSRSI
jgi:FkbM family methyltransferase